MSTHVPSPRPPRPYDASRRRVAAQRTRLRILDAARARFERDGYASTTLAAVAADADVSVQSITKHFRSKPGLVHAIFEAALVADDAPTPLAQRPWIVAIHDEPDPVEQLRMFARTMAAILPRTAPVQLLMRDAAADPEIREVWQRIRLGRLAGMADLAGILAARGHLRPGVTVEQARDVLWTFSSVEVYELYVIERGRSSDELADVIAAGVIGALLERLPPAGQ